jgi:carbohydrate-selective porin OprB
MKVGSPQSRRTTISHGFQACCDVSHRLESRQLHKAGIARLCSWLYGVSQPLKNDLKQLAGVAATVKNENGLEVFYDVAITPAIRLIPNYQHIWNPMTARVAKNEHGADVLLLRTSSTW